MKYLLASLLSIMLSHSVLSEEDEQLLYKCTVTHPDFTTIFTFLIDKNNNHAVDIRDDAGSTRKGTLEISELYYSLVFPSTEGTDTVSGAWESAVVINRGTNEFKIEWGDSPFLNLGKKILAIMDYVKLRNITLLPTNPVNLNQPWVVINIGGGVLEWGGIDFLI